MDLAIILGMTTHQTLRRKRAEGKTAFLERASDAAKAINGSVMTEEGYYCPTCVPFSSPSETAELLPYRVCCNCNYETKESK